MKTKEIAIAGMMTALCIASRYALAPFPNVTAITAIIILLVASSVKMGITVGVATMLITSLSFGFGPWTVLQILAYIVVAIGAKYVNKFAWAVLGCFMYGFITNFSMLPYIPVSALPATWVSGLPFDGLHALSTLTFVIVLYPVWKKYGEKVS